jgi:hypothetical protein
MQHRIIQTNFDTRKLKDDTRRAWRTAVRAILTAHADGRISRDEATDQELALRTAYECTFNDARKITFIRDCQDIVKYYNGGQS